MHLLFPYIQELRTGTVVTTYLENQLSVLRVLLRNKQDKCHTQDVILFANICSILMCSNGFTKAIEILLN